MGTKAGRLYAHRGRSRVVSPSAAKTGAASLSLAAAVALRLRDMALDVLQLFAPSVVVHPERFGAA
jgi:hypothetical protein